MHKSVLLEESIDGLNIKPDGKYVDCTLGYAGHSSEILKKLGTKGFLITLKFLILILKILKIVLILK